MNFFKKLFNKSKKTAPIDIIEKAIHLESNYDHQLIKINTDENEKLERSKKPTYSEAEKNRLIDLYVKGDLELINWEKDTLFDDAARLIVMSQQGSTSLLQRRMKLGYNRAGRLMDQLEIAGIVGQNQGSKTRDVLIKTEAELSNYLTSGTASFNWQEFIDEYKDEIEVRRIEYEEELKQEQIKKEKNYIKKELLEKERKRKLQKEAHQELIEEGLIFNQFMNGVREIIPQDVMDKVWNRDGGKCVQCGCRENLEFDHIIPFSKGGAATYRNLQILCKKCNIEKSNKIG